MILFAFLFSFLISLPSQALEVPTGLSDGDLTELIQILGLSTSSKVLTNPFPLGGYSGVEFGVSLEVIDTSDLSRLGSGTQDQTELKYSKFYIGKGLYNNLDLFFHFIPYSQSNDISEWGGIFKWTFYQASFLPIAASVLVTGSNFDANDQFTSETLGLELMTGMSVENFSLYFGGGQVQSNSKLIDGSTVSSKEVVQLHTFVGISVHISNFFISGQIDRYEQPVYSGKVGMRF